MYSLEKFLIDLRGLTSGTEVREYSLGDDYFDALDVTEVSGGSVHVSASIRKDAGFFELHLQADGVVRVPCNLCLDDMEQPVSVSERIAVKLGTATSEDGDVVMVDENEGMLDLSWLIYEYIALAIPIRHVHAPGKCNAAMWKALEEHTSDRSSDEASTQDIDPRWQALMQLKGDG